VKGAHLERMLARLYTDVFLRERFLRAPYEVAIAEGLGAEEARALAAMDLDAFVTAATSYERKRTRTPRDTPRTS
jgi:hypothetical protein